jgi:A/G-specific adenine glycosylase
MARTGNTLIRLALRWYRAAARDLPWRRRARASDPYAVWISETMLQQTRVQTAIPYYERFLAELPDVLTLAEAPEERVLALWSGLGYYRRARMLHAAAKALVREYGGALPAEPEELRRLAGVGAYTAGAIASIAFGKRAPLVDGNVARVLSRIFCIEEDVKTSAGMARVWALATDLMAEVPDEAGAPGAWNQALMELGATVCTPGVPRCAECPVASECLARARGMAESLPRKTPKRAPRRVARVAIVVASESRVVLARRRGDALFGGLWEPPAADAAERDALASRLGVDAARLRASGRVEHVLSHRRLDVEVLVAPMGRRRRWTPPGPDYDAVEAVPLDELRTKGARAHATLTRKVLAAAGVLGPVGLAKSRRGGLP